MYCVLHATEGMVHVYIKTCDDPGCTRGALYGLGGSRKAAF